MCNFCFIVAIKSGNECYLKIHTQMFSTVCLSLAFCIAVFILFASLFEPFFNHSFFFNGMLSVMWIFQAYFPLSLCLSLPIFPYQLASWIPTVDLLMKTSNNSTHLWYIYIHIYIYIFSVCNSHGSYST